MKKVIKKGSVKSTFILFLVLIGLNKISYSQSVASHFSYYIKADLGLTFNEIENATLFKPKVGANFGSHLMARYTFSKFAISSGFGASSLSFSDKLDFDVVMGESGYSTVRVNYLALDIPFLIHYSLTDRFDIFGGINLMWTDWMSYGLSAAVPENYILNVYSGDDIPDWQFTQEVMVGLSYQLSDRFDLGLNFTKSLKNMESRSFEMEFLESDQPSYTISEKFDYSWSRLNLELAYRLNK